MAVVGALALCLGLAGCGAPGLAPGEGRSSLPGESLDEILAAARVRVVPGTGTSGGPRLAAAGDWRAVDLGSDRGEFRIVPPPGAPTRLVAPRRIRVFTEGSRRVVLAPEGPATMAFRFRPPTGMRLPPTPAGTDAPVHFPGLDLWVVRPGQAVILDWQGRASPGWLGTFPVTDTLGRPVPVEGYLTLPEGYLGVPSGARVFRVGSDRVFGPYSEVRTGLWTSAVDPYPLAASFLDGIFLELSSRLGPAPRPLPDVVVDSCGECLRGPDEPPMAPAGTGDERLLWVRLGDPGYLSDLPPPLYTLPVGTWLTEDPRDPAGAALASLYAQVMFPVSPLLGFALLPPPGLARPLAEALRTWSAASPHPDHRTLSERVLPGILFECRSADAQGFDRAVRELVARRSPVRLVDLAGTLSRVAPRCLAPFALRGLEF